MSTRSPVGFSGSVRTELTTRETAIEVLGRERTTTKVEFERTSTEIRRDGAEKAFRFDTADPAKEQATGEEKWDFQCATGTSWFRAIAGGSVEVEQRPSGMVMKVGGLDVLKERCLKGLAPDDPRRAVVERSLTFPSFLFMLSPHILVPEGSLDVGEDQHFLDLRPLPDTVGLASGATGLIYFKGTFRLAEVKDGAARLELKADVALDPWGGMQPWPAASAKGRHRLRLERGTCRTWSRILVDTGLLEEDEHVTELDLHFVKPDGSGEVPIPTKITNRTRLLR